MSRNQLLAKSEAIFKKYQFTLLNVVEGERVLHYAPDGWSDEFVFQRNKVFRGVFRKYSDLTLHFIKTGRDYLRNIYLTQGPNAIVELKIERWNNSWAYDEIFNGVVNMFTIKFTETTADVQIEDDAKTAKLMNRKKTDVNIFEQKDLDGNVVPPLTTLYNNIISIPELQIQKNVYFTGEGEIVEDGTNLVIPIDLLVPTMDEVQTPSTTGTLKEQAFFKEATQTYSPFRIDYFYYAEKNPSDSATIQFVVIDSDENIKHIEPIGSFGNVSPIVTNLGTAILSLDIGDSVLFVVSWTKVGTELFKFLTHSSGVNTYLLITSPYLINTATAVHIYDAIKRNVLLTSGYSFRSSFFGYAPEYPQDGENLFITAGKNMRGIVGYVPFTLEEAIKSCFAVHNIGIGIENDVVVLEHIDYFYSPRVELDLTNKTTSIEYEVMDGYFSSIEIGYSKSATDEKSGLGEFNTKAAYSTSMNTDKKSSIISKFRADTIGINKLREKPAGDPNNKDVSGDEDIFFLDAIRDGNSFAIRTTEGFDSGPANWFNLRLSIARMIRRHRLNEYLKGSNNLTLQKRDKFSTVKSQETGFQNISELANIATSDLLPPIFIPELIICDAPISIADINSMDMKGLIKVREGVYGWIEKIKYSYKTEKAELELIKADLNNVTPIYP